MSGSLRARGGKQFSVFGDLDSRLRGLFTGPARTLDGKMEQTYCANCGRKTGMVSAEHITGTIAICDDCHARCGPLPLDRITFGG